MWCVVLDKCQWHQWQGLSFRTGWKDLSCLEGLVERPRREQQLFPCISFQETSCADSPTYQQPFLPSIRWWTALRVGIGCGGGAGEKQCAHCLCTDHLQQSKRNSGGKPWGEHFISAIWEKTHTTPGRHIMGPRWAKQWTQGLPIPFIYLKMSKWEFHLTPRKKLKPCKHYPK